MINIIFYCSWGNSSKELLNKYKLMTKNDQGIFNNLKGIDDINSSNIVVFLEGIPTNF